MSENENKSAKDIHINVKDDGGKCDYMHPEECKDKDLKKGKDAKQIQKEIINDLKKQSPK